MDQGQHEGNRSASDLFSRTHKAVRETPVLDIHTHLYSPGFGACGIAGMPTIRTPGSKGDPLLLWGIDELLSYHYFVDELFRALPGQLTPDAFWEMPITERADLVWRELFVNRPPVSESCVGLIKILTSLGLDPHEQDLSGYRDWFSSRDLETHIDEVFSLSGISQVVMTNEPFSDVERPKWLDGVEHDKRFAAVLRVDPIVEQWPNACQALSGWGYSVREDLSGQTLSEVRRFLDDWIDRINPAYLACSLSPSFAYTQGGDVARLFDECLIAAARDHGLMLALMIGAKRAVHPAMRLAGDGLGRADVDQVAALARSHPDVTFMVTMLSRENQHELCVVARKFGNILPFGCWWYVNTTSQIREMTRMRFELLGTSFIPRHSDSRVLEQLIYKWDQSRTLIADCLAERYIAAANAGATITDEQIKADAERLLSGNFTDRLGGGAGAV